MPVSPHDGRTHPLTTEIIRSEAQLRALIGAPAELTCAKISKRLNAMTRLFIERSPFVCLATSDAQLLAPSRVEVKPSRLGPLVDIDEVYTQCSKAFLRSHLWDAERFVDPALMPTGGQVHRAIQGQQFDAEGYDRELAERYRQRVGFY